MADVDFRMIGDKQVERELKRLDMKLQRTVFKKAAKKAIKPVLDAAKHAVPVDTGNLKKSLRSRVYSSRNSFGGQVTTGTRKKLNIDENTKHFYPAVIEFKRKSYLRAPLDANQARVFSELRNELRKALL